MSSPKEMVAGALELYAERNKLAVLYYRLDLPTLKRLNDIVANLSDENLREVVAFAEGLAMWGQPDSSSEDATVPQRNQTPPG